MEMRSKKLKTIKTLDDAWEATLSLWKTLSVNDMEGIEIFEAKDVILKENGYGYILNGCPMCQYCEGIDDLCESCPIYIDTKGCYDTPYGAWELNRYNDTSQAKLFYNYLLDLKKRIECD